MVYKNFSIFSNNYFKTLDPSIFLKGPYKSREVPEKVHYHVEKFFT